MAKTRSILRHDFLRGWHAARPARASGALPFAWGNCHALSARALLLVIVAGCAQVDSRPQIRQAEGLVADRLGYAPDWSVAWDDAAPAWTTGAQLSCDEAIRCALRNNRALRADLEVISQAQADLVQAGLLPNPLVNFSVMFPDGGGLAMLQGDGAPMWALHELWRIPKRKSVAAARLQEAILRVADRSIALAAEVTRVYARLQYTQRAIELMRENIALAQQTVEIIQAQQVAGQATQVELNLAHIRARRLQSDLIAVEADYRSLQRDLLLLVGFPEAPDGWTVMPIHELQFEARDPGDEFTLLQLGAEQRLDLQAAGWTLRAAGERIELARREAWPELAAGVGFRREARGAATGSPTLAARAGNTAAQVIVDRAFGVPPAPVAPTVEPWPTSMRKPQWTIGPMFQIEIPVFDQNQAQIARAVQEYRRSRAEFDDRAQNVVRAIREADLRLRQARAQAEFYRTSVVPDVQRNLELAQQSFVAGRENLIVYLSALEDVIMTRLRVLEYIRDYLVSRADLVRAVGGRLPAAPAAGQAIDAGEVSSSRSAPPTPPPSSEAEHEH